MSIKFAVLAACILLGIWVFVFFMEDVEEECECPPQIVPVKCELCEHEQEMIYDCPQCGVREYQLMICKNCGHVQYVQFKINNCE